MVRREIITHWQLRHDNVLPLLGIFQEEPDGPPLIVTPYKEHGTAERFLKTYGDAETYIHIVSHALGACSQS